MSLVLTVIAAVVMLAWFAAGSIWNVRLGSALMRWMQGGLPVLGERTTVRWLGTTAVELGIHKAKPPFREVTLVVFLEPRDVPWIWALSRRRGRRDTLILRGRLQRPPVADFEALDRESWSGRDALRGMVASEWSVREPSAPGGLATYYRTLEELLRADALLALAGQAGLGVRRMSVRRTEPHLQLHLTPPAPGVSASEFFKAIRAIAERTPS